MTGKELLLKIQKHFDGVPTLLVFGAVLTVLVLVAIISGAATYQVGATLEGIAAIIKAAAWPAVIVITLFLLRGPIAEQFPQITKVTSPMFTLEVAVEQKLTDAKQDAVARGDAAGQLSNVDIERAGEVDLLTSQADLPHIRIRFESLADEYERVRSAMPSSDTRTRAMTVVMTQMRALGRAAYPLRWEFAFSRSPGRRLGALAMLQVQPDLEMLEWAARRVTVLESPFMQYHALQVLLAAARLGDLAHADQVISAYQQAEEGWKSVPTDARTDRRDVLDQISVEVEWARNMTQKTK